MNELDRRNRSTHQGLTEMKSWESIPGWFDWLSGYEQAVGRFRHGPFVEVGCYLGRSLCCLGQLVKAGGKPIRLVGIDTCTGSGEENGADNHAHAVAAGGGTIAGALHRNLIECGVADIADLIVAPSVRAAGYFRDKAVEFVFLDGAHDYESVKADILAWVPKVCVGGWIGGDDLSPIWPGVRQAVEELLPGFAPWSHDSWLYEVR